MNRFVLTCGDINGIGPEICLKTIQSIYNPKKNKIFLVIPQNVFAHYNKIQKLEMPVSISNSILKLNLNPEVVTVVNLGNAKFTIGKPTKESGNISYRSISTAYKLIKNGTAEAMITAPISKSAFQLAGIEFPGHTELLAEWDKNSNYAMTFISKKMKCALITIHEPIKSVSKLLNRKKILSVITTVKKSLINDFNISQPKIAVLALNPHAGENGRIGEEEIKNIIPAINLLGDKNITGPYVPDAFFANHLYKNYDMIIGMYHDQVLIPFKMLNFNSGVNYTAGLNFIRTSPDHGTAFDIAGLNIADPSSLIEAFKVAETVIKNRRKN